MSFGGYMLSCADDSFYVGHTDNLETRIAQLNAGECGGYTLTRRPAALAYSEEFQTREEALSAERQIKGWNRAKKQALIGGDWKRIQQLAWGSRNPPPERLR